MDKAKINKIINKLKFEIAQLASTPIWQEYSKLKEISEQGEYLEVIIKQKQETIKLNEAKLNGFGEMEHQYQAQQVQKPIQEAKEEDEPVEFKPEPSKKQTVDDNPFADDDLEMDDDEIPGLPENI